MNATSALADDDCYLALKTRDARFDGSFFTGVTSTGIYCRPVCSVKTPKRENCRFFGHAAQAEQAGFRPCLRCRPELAPHSVAWSIQDASSILAQQAARWLDDPENFAPTFVAARTALPPEGAAAPAARLSRFRGPDWCGETPTLVAARTALPPEGAAAPAARQSRFRGPDWCGETPTLVAARTTLPPEGAAAPAARQSRFRGPGLSQTVSTPVSSRTELSSIRSLAARLGVSERHVRRIFEAQFGVSPLQYLQTRRLLTAKQLLADTRLPITQIALISGFASVRRFNAAFVQHYQLNPTQLRRQGSRQSGEGIPVRLGYRPPYDVAAMLAFISKRSIKTIEFIADSAQPACITRTFGVESGGKTHTGWLQTSFDETRCQLVLRVSDSLHEVLPLVIHRVRSLFDLDADPAAIHSVLGSSFPGGEGLRVPGTLDGFELAVRAVLGQQITVAAARTLAQRLVEQFGAPIETPWPQLTRLFPSPAVLASASGDALGQLGIVRQRQAAITGLARAVADGRLQLQGSADLSATLATLKEIPGIGDWTAQYIAMRALRWPDAFLAADVALHKALGVQALKNPSREAEKASLAWKPWRSYAVLRAWSGLLNTSPAAVQVSE